jgi:hypothetical protein
LRVATGSLRSYIQSRRRFDPSPLTDALEHGALAMAPRTFLSAATCGFVVLISTAVFAAKPQTPPRQRVLDETPKLFVVNGYSTSFQ